MRWRSPVIFSATLVALSAIGCSAGVGFRRGLELERAGDLHGAHVQLSESLRQASDSDGEEALARVGEAIAAGLEAEAVALERAGDYPAARERYSVALEYASRRVAARVGYQRVVEGLSRWQAAAVEGSSSSTSDFWESFERRLDVAVLPACPDEQRVGWIESALEALEVAVRDLERRSVACPFAVDGVPQRRLDLAWQRLDERLRGWLEREEMIVQMPSVATDIPTVFRDALEEGSLRRELERFEFRSREARGHLGRALDAVTRFESARRLEKEGDLRGAFQAYREVHRAYPDGVDARIAAERVNTRWRHLSYEAAQASMTRGEWTDAIARLVEIREISPRYRDTEECWRYCLDELHGETRRAAADLEARGLPANALLRYVEARRMIPGDEEIGTAIVRLEAVLERRVRPTLALEHVVEDDDEQRLRLLLWKIDEGTFASVRRAIDEGFARRRGGVSGRRAEHDTTVVRVLVDDLDFAFLERAVTQGVERGRFLRSFGLSGNPDVARSERDLQKALERFDRAQRQFDAAPEHARSMQRDLLELARGELEQARFLASTLSPRIPKVTWEERSYPVRSYVLLAELAARYRIGRLGVEGGGVTARWETTDRVADDGVMPGVDPESFEVPPREEVIERLAADLGRRLRAAVDDVFERGRVRYYQQALERLESGALELAVENLVIFLHASRRNEPTLQSRDALRRLQQLTKSDAAREWAGTD